MARKPSPFAEAFQEAKQREAERLASRSAEPARARKPQNTVRAAEDRGDAWEPPGPATAPKSQFEFIDAAEFDATDYTPQWLLPRVLVRGQPGVIAGPSKGMKTSVLMDLALSLTSGTSFLGHFPAGPPVNVAVVSGESGAGTLKETALRVCASKGVALREQTGRLKVCYNRLPTFTDLGSMDDFARSLLALECEVVFIDPTYLCLGGGVDPANLFDMGAAFRVVAEVLLKAGCTPILAHHANRQLRIGDPMELQHLAFSGLEQFARQWLMLNRREAYRGDGVHDLWFSVGGSAGHGGQWVLHIEEGVVDENFRGRFWKPSLATTGEARADLIGQREAAREEAARKRMLADDAKVLDAIDAEASAGQPGATRNRIMTRVPQLSAAKLKAITDRLCEAGLIEEFDFDRAGGKNARQRVSGFRRVPRGPES